MQLLNGIAYTSFLRNHLFLFFFYHLVEELAEMLEEADADRDGVVNAEDFLKILSDKPKDFADDEL